MKNIVGKKFEISGMIIEVISDEGDSWVTLNTTTRETVHFNKKTLEDAIKLGKADEVIDSSIKELSDDSEK